MWKHETGFEISNDLAAFLEYIFCHCVAGSSQLFLSLPGTGASERGRL